MPMPATSQSVAAVVSPRTDNPCRMIAPAPRKPIPLTICAAIRVGSVRTSAPPFVRNSLNPYADTSVKSAEPTETTRWVRSPACRSRSSRSKPIAPPRSAAIRSRRSTCGHSIVGTAPRVWLMTRLIKAQSLSSATPSWKCNCDGFRLDLADPRDALFREVDELVENRARERVLLGGRLYFDQAAVPGHDDVHVGVGIRVLGVVEVEQRHAFDDADGDGGNGIDKGFREAEAIECATCGDVCAADRSATGAAVGLQDIAVEPERPLSQRAEVDDAAHRPPDEPLDLDRSALLLAAGRLALDSVACRRRQERVLRRHPAAALVPQPARDFLLHHRRAEHLRLPLRDEGRTVRVLEIVRLDRQRANLVGPAATLSRHAPAPSCASVTCSTSPIGSCRKRRPISRNASGSAVVRKRYAPSRDGSLSIRFRASVSAASRAVSSAEKTSVTSRPKTRCRIGRISG